uniref:Uncharacterized protein n=1 Tax=Rhizophora mucronata TaxID=61149 RepID=A0A2P2QQT6_RHIMU
MPSVVIVLYQIYRKMFDQNKMLNEKIIVSLLLSIDLTQMKWLLPLVTLLCNLRQLNCIFMTLVNECFMGAFVPFPFFLGIIHRRLKNETCIYRIYQIALVCKSPDVLE